MTAPKPPSLRTQQKNYTRQRLIESARELFLRKGRQNTTVDDIVSAAGISRATFYLHFTGRDDIMRELFSEMWTLGLELYEAFAELPDWSEASISGWLERALRDWERYADSTRLVVAEMSSEVQVQHQMYQKRFVEAMTRDKDKWDAFDAGEAELRAHLLIFQLERCMSEYTLGGWKVKRKDLLRTLTHVWIATLTP